MVHSWPVENLEGNHPISNKISSEFGGADRREGAEENLTVEAVRKAREPLHAANGKSKQKHGCSSDVHSWRS